MQTLAQGWLVYDLTGSKLLLGVVGFSGQICVFALAPFAGVIADRVDRRRLVIATQTGAMIQAFILGALVLLHRIQPWHIIALSAVLGLVNAFDIPARQSFIVEMLEEREDLPNAIALNSFLFNGARLVGPLAAGFVIAAVGTGLCFILNGISYLAVIWALAAMKIAPRRIVAAGAPMLHDLKEGITYAVGSPVIWAVLVNIGLINLLAMPYTVLMPVFAKDVLHGDSKTLAYLQAAIASGALTGALFLASRKGAAELERVLVIGTMVFGAGIALFSRSAALWLSLGLLAVAGFGFMVQMASSNTLVQTVVEDDKRGRVMSLYVMTNRGMGTFGSLMAGGLAAALGAPCTLLMSGIGIILAGCLFAFRLPQLRKTLARGQANPD
jgi:MFS family permease